MAEVCTSKSAVSVDKARRSAWDSWFGDSLMIAALFVVTGYLGHALTALPTDAPLIWPPSGIALAGALLFGRKAWPGIALGSILLDLCTSPTLGPERSSIGFQGTLLADAGAILLQGYLGAFLVRRFGHFPNALDTEKNVLAFFGLGGAVAALAGTTVACLPLMIGDAAVKEGLVFHALSSWAGGTLGVVLFTPLILAWRSPECTHWMGRRRPISLSLGIAFTATLLLVGYATIRERESYRQDLDDLARNLTGGLEKSVSLYADAVASAQGLAAVNPQLDRSAFTDFTLLIRQRVPGIQALNWAPRIAEDERERYETGANGRADTVAIKQMADGKWIPAPRRTEYFPVTFTVPEAQNKAAIGFDLVSNPSRRAALEKARDTGNLVFTERIALVTGSDGILAFLPVYRNGSPTETVEERREALRGVAFGVFRASDLIANAFGNIETSRVNYWLLDDEAGPDSPSILGTNSESQPAPYRLPSFGLLHNTVALVAQKPLHVGERHWLLQIAPTEAFFVQYRENMAWYVLLAGILFTSLISASVLIGTGRERALLRTAEERAAALKEIGNLNERIRQEAESRFNVIVGTVGEAIIIVDERGRVETFNKAAEQTFGYAAEEVLGREISLLMTDEDAPRMALHLEHLLPKTAQKLAERPREITAKRKNGEVFSAELTVGEASEDERIRYVAFLRDITDRKKIERDLRDSERRFRDLAGSASDWFWETDADYQLTFVSERIGVILGVKAAEVVGLSYFDLGLDDHEEIAKAHRRDVAERKPFRDLIFHVGPEGEARDSKFIRLSGIPIFGDEGLFLGYRGIGADITREMLAERRANLAYQQMADAIESVVDAIAVFDAEDQLVICNKEYKRVFGKPNMPPVPGMTYERLLDAGGQSQIFDTDGLSFTEWKKDRLKQHREASGTPAVVHMSNGRWIQNREYRTSDGGTIGVRTDITDLKRREEELEDLRRRYELILDSAGEGIVGLDRLGSVTFANRTAGTILGIDPDAMNGRPFDTLVLPPENGSLLCQIENTPIITACREGTSRQVGADTFFRPDGSSLPVDYLVAPIMEGSSHVGAVMLFRDATLRIQYERSLAEQQHELERQVAERTAELTQEMEVRRRFEEALRASRERHKRITDSLFEGVIGVDRNGHVIFANPSALRLLQWETAEGDIEGYPLDEIFHLRERSRDIAFEGSPWQKVISENIMLRDDDAQFVTSSGHGLSVAYACSLLPYAEGKHAAIISFRDIEALKQAQREAIQSSRMASVGQLAAGIAHEINTPVQYVGDNLRYVGKSFAKFADLAETGRELAEQVRNNNDAADAASRFDKTFSSAKIPSLTAETQDAIRESLEGVAQIARIVLSMKEFSHPGTSTKTTTDINKALESTMIVSRNEWKHAAEIERNLDSSLPMVVCHAGEMNQVFLNLIVNAAHAIEASGKPLPGRITISTSHTEDHIEIRVADNGTGIPENIRDKIFDPFFTTKEVGKGTGQGLAICRDVVVAKHGGTISVVNRAEGGAEFVVSLPIGGEDPQPEDETE
ncbi:PAS domain S-box protein [Telmatospirillum siberiense]|uniref:histidine kinase n=1 Tax=Telmatospirillum siberiense TaxID=382514 RepID=A0A2N3PZG5_9PROT|nr:PAS domain S-box protein [Telmatospirillum siberiense]PKU25800.1 hypothetical protein CWS72_04350 [Telmatospirillum siberiense]